MNAVQIFIPATTVVVALLVFIPMMIEARRAARHEQALRAQGGIEPPGDVYRVMQVAYPGVFLAMIFEQVVRQTGTWPVLFVVGVALFIGGKLFKWWAILSLGPFWTFRIMVMPKSTPVSSGPYRFVAHPNYIGVVGELLGGALMTAAPVAGPLGIVLFSALMLRRVAVESRARDAILRRS